MDFTNKVVLITGASSGIGAETAKLFAERKAKLVLTGRDEEALEEVRKECKAKGCLNILVKHGDLNTATFVEVLIADTIRRYKRLDVLVNNAGILENGGIESTSMAQYDTVMNINIRAVYQLTSLAVPYLIQAEGAIVNVSSVVGLRAFPNILAYCISKAALDQFTRCVALELAPKNVRVNSVNPGVVVTNLHTRSGMALNAYHDFLEKCTSTQPLGRPGCVDEVAKAILFLASDEASFITAATLPVDGGKQASCSTL